MLYIQQKDWVVCLNNIGSSYVKTAFIFFNLMHTVSEVNVKIVLALSTHVLELDSLR